MLSTFRMALYTNCVPWKFVVAGCDIKTGDGAWCIGGSFRRVSKPVCGAGWYNCGGGDWYCGCTGAWNGCGDWKLGCGDVATGDGTWDQPFDDVLFCGCCRFNFNCGEGLLYCCGGEMGVAWYCGVV